MKRIFFILTILSSYVFADSLQDAIKLYEQKSYKQAYEKTKLFLEQYPLNIKANLLIGDCAYKLEEYDLAMAAYDRVLILDEVNVYAKFQEAKIYIKSGQNDMARLELDALLAKKLTPNQKKEVLKLRGMLTKPKKTKQANILNGKVGIGLMYDSNPNTDIGDKNYILPINNLEYNGVKEDDDFAHFENLHLHVNKNIDETFGILGNFNAYNRSYFDMTKNDLSYLSLNLSPYYNVSDFKMYIPLTLNKVFLEHDSYLNAYGGGLDIKKSIKNGLVEAGYRYFENRYYKDNKDKNSIYQNAYVGFRYILFDDLLAYMYAKYAHNKEKKNLRTDVNYDSYGFNFGLRKEIFSSVVARGGFSFMKYKYKDLNRVFLNKRDDKTYNYNVGLTYNINSSHAIDLNVIYTDKTSNQFLYQYDRVLTSLEYIYKF